MMETTANASDTNYDYSEFNKPCEKHILFEFGALFTAVLNSCIFVAALIGNTLVLWIVAKYENLSSITNIFIVNLSITDLVFSSVLPFWAAYHWFGWIYGEPLCKVMSAIFSVGFYSGIISLTSMTIYRYVVVVHPHSALRTRKPWKGVVVCLIIWLTSLLMAIPAVIFSEVHPDNDGFLKCDYADATWEVFSTYQQNLLFLISFAIITFCYVCILRTLLPSRPQRNQKTVKLILTIVVVFFLSWAPYNILMFLKSIDHLQTDCKISGHLDYAMYICEKVAFSHCCLNPVLYALVGIKFRRHLKQMFYRPCIFKEQSSNMRVNSQDNLHHEDFSLY
ncbi:chemokine XC receptor 1-like [Ambystoma mexicanum]|uniref:chemokine XC receptor 1-like n=1 Tax=Ambystoma mexicanum TaxID=8296 RepID=UPI0037E750AA